MDVMEYISGRLDVCEAQARRDLANPRWLISAQRRLAEVGAQRKLLGRNGPGSPAVRSLAAHHGWSG